MENIEKILDHQICGFHQYLLTTPARLRSVSQNLCTFVGLSQKELLDTENDRYMQLVYPSDREIYKDFLDRLSQKEQMLTAEYRLMKQDGTLIWVRDTMTSTKNDAGELIGTSVLTDITALMSRIDQGVLDLQFWKEEVPCGFLRYTCERQPQITEMDSNMLELLRFPEKEDGEMDDLELYKSNIFLMIPMEDRRRFSRYLEEIRIGAAPVAGEITLLRCDGTRARVLGWTAKRLDSQGNVEFQSICMDITERYRVKETKESQTYQKALADVYDKIFEFNLDANTVKCLHCEETSYFKQFENIAMRIEDALEKWLISSADWNDQERIRRFFQDFCQKKLRKVDGKPPQITYQARSSENTVKQYTGIFIKINEFVSFYCCREMKDQDQAAALKEENIQLKGKMRDLVMQFSDGIAAFEVSPQEMVKPLYASENVCEFFGYTKEEWLPLTETFTPLKQFIVNSEAAYEDFAALLQTGEAEFTYFDYKTETERRIKAICSEKEPDFQTSRYVMLYAVEEEHPKELDKLPEKQQVFIRTFGYFDVFVGDTPIAFRNKKAKELFALLVDRKGGFVTSEEAISFLWEEEPVNPLTLSRYRKVALRLKSTLEEYGISDLVEAVDGKRRLVMDRVTCDLYQYLSGKEEYAQLFKGSYLMNYSWGEITLGELLNNWK